jgi:hypothetical protein
VASPAPQQNPAPAPAADTEHAPASPAEAGESEGASWFDALTGRGPADPEPTSAPPEEHGTQPAEAAPEQSVEGSEPAEAQDVPPEPTPPAPRKTEPGPDDVVRLTRTQLERRVQAEADRRDAKRAAEARKRAEAEAVERKLREDPYGASEEMLSAIEQQKAIARQTEEVHALLRSTSQQFDRDVIHPIVTSLPPEAQQRLVNEIKPVGLEGRAKLLQAVVAETRKQAKAEGRAEGEKAAEAKLRKNPAFRKELLAELRGSEDEPELLPNGGRSPKKIDMDDWIRAAANAVRTY